MFNHSLRVRSTLAAWRAAGASRQVLRWLGEGVRVPWDVDGPPAPFHHGVSSFTQSERAWLSAEMQRGVATGAYRPAERTTHVSRAFVHYSKGKPRLVVDLRWVNAHCALRRCRFEGLERLRRMARRGDWMWSVDLSDAYHHIAYHEDDVHFFTFGIELLDAEGRVFTQYISTPALAFGWTLSPYIFTTVMKVPVGAIRNPRAAELPAYGARVRAPPGAREGPGTRALPWLDDIAFFSQGSLAQARSARDGSFALLDSLGLARAPDKGQPEPSHLLRDHLGYAIDSDRGLFLLPPRRTATVSNGAHLMLQRWARGGGRVRARHVAAFAGLGQSTGLAVRLARFMLRALQDDLSTRRGWGGTVVLSRQSVADLRWWAGLRSSPHVGRAIWRPADSRLLHVDASSLGWGAALDQARSFAPAAGFWAPEEIDFHITWKELRTVRLAVTHFLPQLAGHRVCLREDNMAVVWILTHFVSRSPVLMAELRKLAFVLEHADIELRPLYIRSAENVLADYASRLAFSGDFMLESKLFDRVVEWWGPCTVDAFASPATAMLPRYWAPAPIAGAEAADAFAQVWRGERLWIHPPPSLLLHVVQMLEATGADAIVCAPHWPGAAWFGPLRELSEEVATFPPGSLRRVAGDAPPQLHAWPVTVFRVDGMR